MMEELVPKMEATTVVWKGFGCKKRSDQMYKKKTKKKNIAICKTCRKTVRTKGSHIVNLFYHLNQKHPLKYTGTQKSREESSTAIVGSKPSNKSPNL